MQLYTTFRDTLYEIQTLLLCSQGIIIFNSSVVQLIITKMSKNEKVIIGVYISQCQTNICFRELDYFSFKIFI